MWKFWVTREEREELNAKRDEEMGRKLAAYIIEEICVLRSDDLRADFEARLRTKDAGWFRTLWRCSPGQRRMEWF